MFKTPWGRISKDFNSFSFRPKWNMNFMPYSSDGHFVEDELEVNMKRDGDNLHIISITSMNQNFSIVYLEPSLLPRLTQQGAFRYRESSKHIIALSEKNES